MDQYRIDMENNLKQSPIDGPIMSRNIAKIITHHDSHLKKSAYTKWLSISSAALLIVGIFAITLIISPLNFSKSISNAPSDSTSTIPLVEGEGIRIMPEQYFLYKDINEMVNTMPDLPQTLLSDEQIVEQLIIDELAYQYAINVGLEITPEQLDKEILLLRNALDQTGIDNPVKELMTYRVTRSGLTEDEYYASTDFRKLYESSLLIGKLNLKLLQDRNIEGLDDGTELKKFKESLLSKHKDKLTINWSTIGK